MKPKKGDTFLLKAEVVRVDENSVTFRMPVYEIPVTVSRVTLEMALERESVLPAKG